MVSLQSCASGCARFPFDWLPQLGRKPASRDVYFRAQCFGKPFAGSVIKFSNLGTLPTQLGGTRCVVFFGAPPLRLGRPVDGALRAGADPRVEAPATQEQRFFPTCYGPKFVGRNVAWESGHDMIRPPSTLIVWPVM
jgi:hypothetical protein